MVFVIVRGDDDGDGLAATDQRGPRPLDRCFLQTLLSFVVLLLLAKAIVLTSSASSPTNADGVRLMTKLVVCVFSRVESKRVLPGV